MKTIFYINVNHNPEGCSRTQGMFELLGVKNFHFQQMAKVVDIPQGSLACLPPVMLLISACL